MVRMQQDPDSVKIADSSMGASKATGRGVLVGCVASRNCFQAVINHPEKKVLFILPLLDDSRNSTVRSTAYQLLTSRLESIQLLLRIPERSCNKTKPFSFDRNQFAGVKL